MGVLRAVIHINFLPIVDAFHCNARHIFSSSSVVSRDFSALCVHSTFGHHPHSLGYLCVKFRFCGGPHCEQYTVEKNRVFNQSINQSVIHSPTQLIWCPVNRFGKKSLKNTFVHCHQKCYAEKWAITSDESLLGVLAFGVQYIFWRFFRPWRAGGGAIFTNALTTRRHFAVLTRRRRRYHSNRCWQGDAVCERGVS